VDDWSRRSQADVLEWVELRPRPRYPALEKPPGDGTSSRNISLIISFFPARPFTLLNPCLSQAEPLNSRQLHHEGFPEIPPDATFLWTATLCFVGRASWMWTLAFGHHEHRIHTHGYAPARSRRAKTQLPHWKSCGLGQTSCGWKPRWFVTGLFSPSVGFATTWRSAPSKQEHAGVIGRISTAAFTFCCGGHCRR
jgi:hypothetical protein